MTDDTRAAHRLLDAARAGADVSEAEIMRCLAETGDLSGISRWRAEHAADPVSADRLHRHLLATSREILAESGFENVDDDFAIEWAETLLRQNRRQAQALGLGGTP